MVTTSWQVQGEYFEACSCDYLCPCLPSNMTAQPTQGSCDVPLVFHIEHGRSGDVSLDGLNFVVVVHTPGIMVEGNWTVGLIVDDRADQHQVEAISGIASGQAGGPMAALGPLIGDFKGVEQRPIHVEMNGMTRSVSIPGVLDAQVEGVSSGAVEGEPIYLENVGHPVNSRLALARASSAHLDAFGIKWDETNGHTNGHFAPFHWSG